MKPSNLIVLCTAALLITGCGTTTTSRVGSGALGGAAAGAAIGSLSGDAGKGALIGGAAGALGGALLDANQKDKERQEQTPPQRRDYY
jgi:uncharacterized membrane protein